MAEPALNLTTPIGGVPAAYVQAVWDKVEPILNRVVTPDTGYNLEHVRAQLLSEQWQMWVVGNFAAVVITSINIRPLHRSLWVMFVAGDHMDEWLGDWLTMQEAYALAHGCSRVEFSGRAGWERYLRRLDPAYEKTFTTVCKDLTR